MWNICMHMAHFPSETSNLHWFQMSSVHKYRCLYISASSASIDILLNNLHFAQFLFNLHHNTVTVVLHIPVYPCHASPHLPSRHTPAKSCCVCDRYIILMKTPNKWKVKVCPNLLLRNAIKIECDCYYLGPASPLTCCWPDTWCMGECNEWTAQADPGRTLLIAREVHIKNNILTQPRKIAENVKNVYCSKNIFVCILISQLWDIK